MVAQIHSRSELLCEERLVLESPGNPPMCTCHYVEVLGARKMQNRVVHPRTLTSAMYPHVPLHVPATFLMTDGCGKIQNTIRMYVPERSFECRSQIYSAIRIPNVYRGVFVMCDAGYCWLEQVQTRTQQT